MRFVIFVIDDGNNLANPHEMQNIDAFNEKLQEHGHFITAAGIASGPNAKTIDNRNHANLVIQGSIQPGPENYTGFWLIEAENETTAEQLAFEGSFACNRKVELRSYLR